MKHEVRVCGLTLDGKKLLMYCECGWSYTPAETPTVSELKEAEAEHLLEHDKEVPQ